MVRIVNGEIVPDRPKGESTSESPNQSETDMRYASHAQQYQYEPGVTNTTNVRLQRSHNISWFDRNVSIFGRTVPLKYLLIGLSCFLIGFGFIEPQTAVFLGLVLFTLSWLNQPTAAKGTTTNQDSQPRTPVERRRFGL
jgi:hypothetical protein